MRQYLSGTKAAAEAAKLAEVNVVAAYPITPQTSIVEYLASFVANGELQAQMIPVESEHSAMSATYGASLAGARTFTASSSQGLCLMHEVLFMASGLRLPIVMAVANRSLASPVSIFADHQDSLAQRDTGWLQFYVENCQEVLDTILLAYRVAEDQRVLLPVMVCFDGFYVSHISEPVDVPTSEQVKSFLPAFRTNYPTLDLTSPKMFNVMAFPDSFEEFQRDKHESMRKATKVIKEAMDHFAQIFGRNYGMIETYRTEDAELVLVGLGSMMGTVKASIDILRSEGLKVGMAKIKAFRPFPFAELAEVLQNAKAVGVLDRDISFGSTGIVYQEVLASLKHLEHEPLVLDLIAGLGGRDITVDTVVNSARLLQEASEAGYGKDRVIWVDANQDLLNTWKVGAAHVG